MGTSYCQGQFPVSQLHSDKGEGSADEKEREKVRERERQPLVHVFLMGERSLAYEKSCCSWQIGHFPPLSVWFSFEVFISSLVQVPRCPTLWYPVFVLLGGLILQALSDLFTFLYCTTPWSTFSAFCVNQELL